MRVRYVHKTLWGVAALAGVLGLAGLVPELASAQEPSKTSAAFERFRFSFFEDTDSARQGLDTVALAQLAGEERTRAEDMLIRYLPDSRGIIGLGVLRSRRAEPGLVGLFEAERLAQGASKLRRDSDWLPYRLIFLAKALWQIRPNPRWPAAVIDVLASADEPIQRQTAAEELYDVRDPATVRALMTALDDPEGLVRHHAARGLLAIHGLPVDSDDAAHMTYRVMSDDAARREGGKRDILAAIAGRPIAAP
ncbi:MAG: HEAT repeat domain-containing protein [Xanthobacteraceae bacterium]